MMNHLSEEELILHYYSEEADAFAAEHHLDECDECRAHYASLQRVLNVVDTLPVPARGEEYGGEIWRRIERRLPSRRRWWIPEGSWAWAGTAAAFASLVVVAFLAGRMFPRVSSKAQPVQTASVSAAVSAADKQAGERVLLVAVGDMLERSQMVLIELNHATPVEKLDISAERPARPWAPVEPAARVELVAHPAPERERRRASSRRWSSKCKTSS